MAFEINFHVKKEGVLEPAHFDNPIDLSVYKESKRVKLTFQVDSEIDSEYHYLKFTHKDASYLYRVHNNSFEIPKAITSYEGRWEVSFICCDEPANPDSTITADYIYASIPFVADVAKGNLGYTAQSEEQIIIKELCHGTFTHFEVPYTVQYLCAGFLSNYVQDFTVLVHSNVTQFKEHVFYQSGCTKIEFEEGSSLTTLDDNALYRITNLGNIKFPASLSSWGKYNLSYCGCPKIEFEVNSNLKNLTSYALWNLSGTKIIYLPDRLESFSGGTAVVKSCPLLEELRFPNTITTAIPQNSIQDCPNLTKITLQSNFNVSANFSNCTNLSHDSIVAMFQALKDLGEGTKNLTIGSINLAKVSEAEKDIALNKGWSLA